MTMEKTGEIKPDKTPDTEGRLDEKKAAEQTKRQQTRELDDDATHRLADAASK